MNEAQQSKLLTQNASRLQRQVIYVPPDSKSIDHFARECCQQLALRGNTSFGEREIESGLAAFMNLASQITTKKLNQRAKLK